MKSFTIMNYSTTVPVEKTLFEIERLLSKAGSSKIARDYSEDGKVTAFYFAIPTKRGELSFRLPCDADSVYRVLAEQHPAMRWDTKKRLREQADRVAWRIVLDWTKAQLTMINLEQVKPEQAFLPYAYDARTGQTLFEKLEHNNFMLLD